jgi:hypothetical protein
VKFDVLLLVTEAAWYMKKAAGLSVSYPKLIHVLCVVHALHRVCKTIHVLCPNTDKLVANGKKILVKSSARIELLKKQSARHMTPSNSSNYTLGNLVGCHCVLCRKL